MLHVISHPSSKFDHSALLATINIGDVIVLMQDGVSVAIKGNSLLTSLLECTANIYVLQCDLQARGLLTMIADMVTMVDYEHYVDLTAEHVPQVLW